LKEKTFRIICLCTPDFTYKGFYGVNSLYHYAKLNGYKFTVYKERMEKKLHINFTKNSILIDALKKYKEDYIVLVDVDIVIKNLSIKILELFEHLEQSTFYAPKDFWATPKRSNGFVINMGFSIWKNCERSIQINEKWLHSAKNECAEMAVRKPVQQRVFHNCIYPFLNKDDLQFLDHHKVGMRYSSFILQERNPRKLKIGWENCGSPDYSII